MIEKSPYELLRPVISYFWVVALIFVTGMSVSVGLSFAKPQLYQSRALLAVDDRYLRPESVANIITAQAAADMKINARVLDGGILDISAVSQYKSSVQPFLVDAIDDTGLRAENLLPDHVKRQQETMAQIQDISVILNESETVTERAVSLSNLINLVANYHNLVQLVNEHDRFIQVAVEPTWAQPIGNRFEPRAISLVALAAFLAGCGVAYVLDARKTALAART